MLLDVRCPGCQRTYWRLRAPICTRCLAAFDHVIPLLVPGVDFGVASALHEGRQRQIVLAGKSGGRSTVFSQLGQYLARCGRADCLPEAAATVCWVPASPSKRRQRGYDQGELLARSLAGTLGLPVRNLLRRRSGVSQTGRSRAQRQLGPALAPRRQTAGSIVLVDDVVTTGVSLASAATALRSAGASEVSVLALTTKLAPGDTFQVV